MARSRTAALLAALATLSACGGGGGNTAATTTTIAGTPGAGSEAPAPAALQFSAPAVGGGTIDFADFAGQTLALWFWAPT